MFNNHIYLQQQRFHSPSRPCLQGLAQNGVFSPLQLQISLLQLVESTYTSLTNQYFHSSLFLQVMASTKTNKAHKYFKCNHLMVKSEFILQVKIAL